MEKNSMKNKIEDKLNNAFSPTTLKVVNESNHHSGHTGDDGSGESHFAIQMSAPSLQGLSRVDAQRRVYDVLKEEMKIIHALSLKVI